jgi:putative transposase
MGYMVSKDDGWRMPDWLWERIMPLLPAPPFHPLGCHAPRVPDRDAMEAILLVLRTGMQWNALNATGVCSSSSAHRRFQEWERAGVFHEIWRRGLLDYDEQVGIDWSFLAADGAMTKAPLAGPKTGPNPTDRAKKGRNDQSSQRARVSRSGSITTARTATITSCWKARWTQIPIQRPQPTKQLPQAICLDKAYDNAEVRDLVCGYELTPHIRARGEEIAEKVRTPGWRARRWVVEASHSWLNRNRAILIRWSKKDENHLALLQLASGMIAFKKAHAARLALAQPR